MRILNLSDQPFHELEFLDAGSRGQAELKRLPFHLGTVDSLPEGIDCWIVTADLQGREFSPRDPSPRLLGEAVVDELIGLSLAGDVPSLERSVALLCGDFYTVPAADRRGGTGDVRPVWRDFAREFRCVGGVAGNHDTFADGDRATERFFDEIGAHSLDRKVVSLGGIRAGGVHGIIGKPTKNMRSTQEDFYDWIGLLLDDGAEVLALHDGPNIPERRLRGQAVIRMALEQSSTTLVFRGHCHWDDLVVDLENGTQVVSAHERVLVLTAP
ncbi:MAG: hypothetical protein AAF517_16515 [Planctomycetota bacterium]